MFYDYQIVDQLEQRSKNIGNLPHRPFHDTTRTIAFCAVFHDIPARCYGISSRVETVPHDRVLSGFEFVFREWLCDTIPRAVIDVDFDKMWHRADEIKSDKQHANSIKNANEC